VERESTEKTARKARPATTRIGGELNSIRVNGHKRELRRHEETVGEDQQQDDDKSERGVDGLSLLSVPDGAAARPRPPATMTMLELEWRTEAPGEFFG